MASSYSTVSSILLLLCLAVSIIQCSAEDFSYTGATGPDNWATLKPEYSSCNGNQQSPVVINKAEAILNPNLGTLNRNYQNKEASLVNFGPNIGVKWTETPGQLVIDGIGYDLIQLHYHVPSEHKIDGVEYAAEQHLLNKASDGSLAVISTLYEKGAPDSFISKLEDALGKLPKEDLAEIPLQQLDLASLNEPAPKYYRYIGSLTTPPCTENVKWSVISQVKSISENQLHALKSHLIADHKSNARPTQLLNGRTIESYE